jgi:hypothetical protein
LTGLASSATGRRPELPIDPAPLAKSIATLTALDPERELARTLEQAVLAAKQLFMVDAAGVLLADNDGNLRWATPPTSAPRASRQPEELRRWSLHPGVRDRPTGTHA